MTINKDEAIELAQHLRAEHASESWCWDSLLEAASMIEALAATSHIAPDAADAIHYPACWDTAAYPTVNDALSAVYDHFKCSECASAIAPKASELPNGELLTEDQRDRIIAAMAKAWPAGFKDTPYKAMSQLAWNIEQACMAAIAMHRAAATKPIRNVSVDPEFLRLLTALEVAPKYSRELSEASAALVAFINTHLAAAEPVPTITSLIEKHGSILHAANEQSRLATKPAASEAVGVPEKLAMRDDTFTVIPQNMVEYQMSVREPDNDNDLFRVAFEDACREDKPDGAEETMFAWDFFKYGWLAAIRILATPAAPTDAGVRDAAEKVLRYELDGAAQYVHVCDRDNDDIKVKTCSDEIQALYAALKSSPQAPKTEGDVK